MVSPLLQTNKILRDFCSLIEGADAGGRNSTTPRSGAESARRAETPDKLPPEDPEETT